jgi:HSP20 family protein
MEEAMFITTRDSHRDTTPDLTTVSSRLNRLLSDAFGGLDWQYRDSAGASWVPPVDIFEDTEAIRIMAEVPGVRAADVNISLEGNLLAIHGQKQQLAEERTERVHRYERTYGQFERTFTLPASVDPNKIKATYDLGVLTVTLPKVERARPRQIQVEVAQQEQLKNETR